MKHVLLLLVVLFSGVYSHGQQFSKKELKYKPGNLDEAVAQLDKLFSDTAKQQIRSMSEGEYLANSHFGLGMWIRNEWGLWKGKELARYFNAMGLFHPDDMSGIILASYYRHLNGKDWDVENEVKRCLDYWKRMKIHDERLKTDPNYKDSLNHHYDSMRSVYLETKKFQWSNGKKVSGYINYQCGFFSGGMRTKVEGTILRWNDALLVIHIDKYTDEGKKKKVLKCNEIADNVVSIEDHDNFELIDD